MRVSLARMCSDSVFIPAVQKLEARTATDEDLKLTDLLRYYERDTKAALGMMYRRIRSLADLQNTTKALDKAKQKGKGVNEVCHFTSLLTPLLPMCSG